MEHYDPILVVRQQPELNMGDLGKRLKNAKNVGVTISSVAAETGLNRSALSTLANNGAANLNQESMEKLAAWLTEFENRRGAISPASSFLAPAPALERKAQRFTDDSGGPAELPLLEKKSALEIFKTEEYEEVLGFCQQMIENHKIGVVIGVPGTGKTTVARTICDLVPKCLYIEAWKSMRLGDLLEEIGIGMGMQLRGTNTSKTRELIRALRDSGYTLVIDEAENLKNHQVEKLDVLRKLHDNTGIPLLLFGTPMLSNVLKSADVTQLSRRMYTYKLNGVTAREIRKELEAYSIEADAADMLSRIAADSEHGGMGSYTMLMEFCLDFAGCDMITMDIVREARKYKIGLRKCS